MSSREIGQITLFASSRRSAAPPDIAGHLGGGGRTGRRPAPSRRGEEQLARGADVAALDDELARGANALVRALARELEHARRPLVPARRRASGPRPPPACRRAARRAPSRGGGGTARGARSARDSPPGGQRAAPQVPHVPPWPDGSSPRVSAVCASTGPTVASHHAGTSPWVPGGKGQPVALAHSRCEPRSAKISPPPTLRIVFADLHLCGSSSSAAASFVLKMAADSSDDAGRTFGARGRVRAELELPSAMTSGAESAERELGLGRPARCASERTARRAARPPHLRRERAASAGRRRASKHRHARRRRRLAEQTRPSHGQRSRLLLAPRW